MTAAMDPTATSFDLDADGKTDMFLTLVIPFQDLVNQILAKFGVGFNFDQSTPCRLIALVGVKRCRYRA